MYVCKNLYKNEFSNNILVNIKKIYYFTKLFIKHAHSNSIRRVRNYICILRSIKNIYNHIYEFIPMIFLAHLDETAI